MRVMAVDPGGVSGWVVYDGPSRHRPTMDDLLEIGFTKGKWVQQSLDLAHIAWMWEPDTLVIEGFRIPGRIPTKKADLLLPVRIASGLEALMADMKNAPRIVIQQPSQMGVITDERLKRWGLWHTQKDIRAAIKHLLIFLRSKTGTPD